MARLAHPLRAPEPGRIQPAALDQQAPERLVDRGGVVHYSSQFVRGHAPAMSSGNDDRSEQPHQPERERKMRPEGDPVGPSKLTPDERRGQGEREPG